MLVRELANISFEYHKHGIVIALKSYIDGSGKDGVDDVVTVGGYFARDETCEWIEREWINVIHSEGIEVFHLSEFGTPHCKYGTGSWDLAKKISFLKRLASVINQPSVWFASVSVETHAALLNSSALCSIHGPAYSWCAQMCLSLIEHLMHLEGVFGEKMAYAFEKGERQHEISYAFKEYENQTPELQDKRTLHFLPKATPLMQPADLIAGVTHIGSFGRYYSHDGTTAALMSSAYSWVVDAGNVSRKRLWYFRNLG